MKLAFVTPWYGEFAGGAEVIVREAAETLASKGINVEVLTTCVRTPFDNWWRNEYAPGTYKMNGVVVRRFPVNTGTENVYHEINYKIINRMNVTREDELKYLKGSISSNQMVEFISKNKTDYVFMLSPYLYGLIYWAYKSAPDRCILLPCLHDEPQAYFSTTRELMQSVKVLFKSFEEMELAKRVYGASGDNYIVIGDGVKSHSSYNPDRFRDKYGIEGSYLLSVGRKDKGKNVHLLVEYFDYYKQSEHDNLKLVFIGGGDDSLVPKRDYFVDLGFIDEDAKYDAYAGALASCQLSKNEAFSLVIMESWLAMRPVIVSDGCPVTKGHCIRSNGGLFVSNREEFAAVIKYMKDHPIITNRMGSNGKRYVLENYTWEKVIQKYINAYKEFGGEIIEDSGGRANAQYS